MKITNVITTSLIALSLTACGDDVYVNQPTEYSSDEIIEQYNDLLYELLEDNKCGGVTSYEVFTGRSNASCYLSDRNNTLVPYGFQVIWQIELDPEDSYYGPDYRFIVVSIENN